jgi:hypothetical protein
MNRLGLVLIVVAGCKGGGDKEQSGDRSAGKAGCEITAKTPAQLVSGKTPQLIAPFSALKLGMSPADAATSCPNLFQGDVATKTGPFSVGEIVGKFGDTYAQGRLSFDGGKLVSVELSLPPGIGDALTAAWGAPVTSTGDKPARVWLDNAANIRAILSPPQHDDRVELSVSSFAPLAAFVEPDTKTIAFKPQSVLGRQPADLAKDFAQYLRQDKTSAAVNKKTDELMAEMTKEVAALGIDTKRNENLPEFRLPASPLGADTTTHVILHTNDDGSVRSYGVWFRTGALSPAYAFPSQSADLVKKLDEVWGPHKERKETLGTELTWYDAKHAVRAATRIEKPEQLDVSYVRYLPLANFFGPSGPVWGFEKAERPLIGATPDEIEATYSEGAQIKRDDKAGTITMSLPPTDYDGDTARTTILMFVRGGKVAEWRTHIPFDTYEPARAEYAAALEAKLGKPNAAKDHFLYGKKPTVDVQYSKYTNELNIQVR